MSQLPKMNRTTELSESDGYFYTDQELDCCNVIPKGVHEIFIMPRTPEDTESTSNIVLSESVLHERKKLFV